MAREPGYDDNSIAKKFFAGGPHDTRPLPGEAVRRSSPAYAAEQAGASPKDFVGGVQSRDADRPPERDRQGVVRPGHGGKPAPQRDPLGTGPRGRVR